MTGKDAACDRRAEHDRAALMQANEGITPFGIVGRKAGAGDGNQAAAGRETRESRG